MVVDPAFTWGDDRPPRRAWADTVVYELHVKSFTRLHPGVPEALRGTYAGLASEAAVEHLLALGVTAVELLPVHHHALDHHLLARGLPNHWGYNTLAFFAPDARYSSAGPGEAAVREFKSMVRALHAAGLEVLLDVVYNHTPEGDHLGPTLSLRGIDNVAYYRLKAGDRSHYVDWTGLRQHARPLAPARAAARARQPAPLGGRDARGRLPLRPGPGAGTRGRGLRRRRGLLRRPAPGPRAVARQARGRALGPGPGRLPAGRLPAALRRVERQVPRGRAALLARRAGHDLASWPRAWRAAATSTPTAAGGPQASVNFVTSHDGFTLLDLVSYETKRNEANLEENADGDSHNLSANHGVDGPSDDPAVRELRARQRRNLLATLLLSQGVPMLRYGDELGHSQQGNNNAYCQDNEISWLGWELDSEGLAFLDFARRLVQLRHDHPSCAGAVSCAAAARPRRALAGAGRARDDCGRLAPPAGPQPGHVAARRGARGARRARPAAGGRHAAAALQRGPGPVHFRLPEPSGAHWERLLDTADPEGVRPFTGRVRYELAGRSVAVLRLASGKQRRRGHATPLSSQT